MTRRAFRSLLAIVSTSIVLGGLGLAWNNASAASDPPARSEPSNHGLVLILSQDSTPEPSDSSELKNCLARNVPLACVLLTITIKNEGSETLFTWWSTCGYGYLAFDLQKQNGNWELFPPDVDRLAACDATGTYVQKLGPGENHTEKIRLADALLQLETSLPSPDDGRIHPRHPGSDFLLSPGTHKIRLRWGITGCVASSKLKTPDALNPFTAQSFCAERSGQMPAVPADPLPPPIVTLQSNELELSPLTSRSSPGISR